MDRCETELILVPKEDWECDMGCGRLAEVRLIQNDTVRYMACSACLVSGMQLYDEWVDNGVWDA